MGWWVLKHRRHEGPFTEEALHQELRKGRFRAEDYALSGDDLDAGRLEYVPLTRVLQLKPTEAAPDETPALVPSESTETRAANSAESTAAQIQASFSTPVNPASLAGFEAADFVPGISKGSRARRTPSTTLSGVSMTLTSTTMTNTGPGPAADAAPVAPAAARNSLPKPVRLALVVAIAGALAWMAFDKFKNGGAGDVAGAKRPASTTAARPDIPTIVRKNPRADSSRSLRLPDMPDTREREPMATPGMMPMADLNSAPPPPDMLPPPQTEPAYNTGFAGPAGDMVPPPPPASEYDAPPAPPPPPMPDMPGLPEAAE